MTHRSGLIRFITITFFTIISYTAVGQAVPNPVVFSVEERLNFPIRTIQADFSRNQEVQQSKFPLYAGESFAVSLSSDSDSGWVFMPNSRIKVWQSQIRNAEENDLVLYFDRLALLENEWLFVIDGRTKEVLNLVQATNNPTYEQFALGPFHQKDLLLQLQVPFNHPQNQLIINEIGILQQPVQAKGFGTSDFCEVNVNCSEGQSWQKEKRGVARILVKQGSSLFYCSGSLINNTKRDRTPLFFTANHCGKTSSAADYNQWIFYFNYEATACENPSIEPDFVYVTGAQLLASAGNEIAEGSDFKLLQLNQDVPSNANAYFNGWNRSNTRTNSGVTIHHPDGDIKKISTYNQQPISTNYGGGNEIADEKYWRVNWSETANGFGVTEGGSSGSPLFDANGLIVGALTGGLASCDNNGAPDYYGKIGYSWVSNSASAQNQLAPWLDPLGSGDEQLAGIGIDAEVIVADFEADHTDIVVGQKVVFKNLSFGSIDDFQWSFEGGSELTSTKELPEAVVYNHLGNFDVQLVVSRGSTTDTLMRENYINVLPALYPNPSNGMFRIDFGAEVPSDLIIEVYDNYGRSMLFTAVQVGSYVDLNLAELSNGLYLVRYQTNTKQEALKLLKY